MPKPPTLSEARRLALPATGTGRTAIGMLAATSVLEEHPLPNPLTALRKSRGLQLEDLAAATGLLPGVFLMIETAAREMSAREILALRAAYDGIADAHARGGRAHSTLPRGDAWDALNEIGERIDADVARGLPVGEAWLRLLRPCLAADRDRP